MKEWGGRDGEDVREAKNGGQEEKRDIFGKRKLEKILNHSTWNEDVWE